MITNFAGNEISVRELREALDSIWSHHARTQGNPCKVWEIGVRMHESHARLASDFFWEYTYPLDRCPTEGDDVRFGYFGSPFSYTLLTKDIPEGQVWVYSDGELVGRVVNFKYPQNPDNIGIPLTMGSAGKEDIPEGQVWVYSDGELVGRVVNFKYPQNLDNIGIPLTMGSAGKEDAPEG